MLTRLKITERDTWNWSFSQTPFQSWIRVVGPVENHLCGVTSEQVEKSLNSRYTLPLEMGVAGLIAGQIQEPIRLGLGGHAQPWYRA